MGKNTKKTILRTALQLFNDEGLAKTTLRRIAQEMGISQGNLNYHFKKREDILEALYFELVSKMDTAFAAMEHSEINISNFYFTNKEMMRTFYHYRFFMLDFVQIIRDNAKIKAHYFKLSQIRALQFVSIIQLWIDAGYIREEEFEGEFQNLYLRIHIIGDFWTSVAYNKQELSLEYLDKYSMASFQSVYPYFTPKGKAEFRLLMGL